MLKELIAQQKRDATHFFETLDLTMMEQLIQIILNCSGTIFLTGVGKSGLIAKKIALTMVSTGTRAFYLSPTDALHGDLGMVNPQDIFILFSKSGESDELLHLIPALRNKEVFIVGVVCNPQSRLGAVCQIQVTLPFQRELCPFDMAPTTSTAFQLLFGDLLTVALMRHRNFSLDEYALNHPSGRLGKRMILKVKDVMLKGDRIPICHPEDSLGNILVELSNKRCGCILIVDEEQKLKGIFTDGDLRRTLQKVGNKVLDVKMQDVMTLNPAFIQPNELAWQALQRMEGNPQKRMMMLPVIDENACLVGLIHLHDLLQSGV